MNVLLAILWRVILPMVGVALLAYSQIAASLLAAGGHVSSASWYSLVAVVALASLLYGLPNWQWWRHERDLKRLRFTNRLLAGVVVDKERGQDTSIQDLQSALRVYNVSMGVRAKPSSPGLRYALEDVLARLESRDWDTLGISLAVPEEAIRHARGTIKESFLKEIPSRADRR